MSRWILVLMLPCLGTSLSQAGEVFQAPDGLFTLSVPDGFIPVPAPKRPPDPSFLCTYYLPVKDASEIPITLAVQTLGGIIGPEHLTREDLKKFQFADAVTELDLSRAIWQGFEIDVMSYILQKPECGLCCYSAQIPTRRQAVQVLVIGPKTRQQEVRTYLEQALKGLEGESNWASSALPSSDKDGRPNVAFLIGLGTLIFLGGLTGLWLLSRVTPKGYVLAAAVVIWLIGAGFENIQERACWAVGGSMKLLGCAGAILGIADVLRKRKKAKPPESADAISPPIDRPNKPTT